MEGSIYHWVVKWFLIIDNSMVTIPLPFSLSPLLRRGRVEVRLGVGPQSYVKVRE